MPGAALEAELNRLQQLLGQNQDKEGALHDEALVQREGDDNTLREFTTALSSAEVCFLKWLEKSM